MRFAATGENAQRQRSRERNDRNEQSFQLCFHTHQWCEQPEPQPGSACAARWGHEAGAGAGSGLALSAQQPSDFSGDSTATAAALTGLLRSICGTSKYSPAAAAPKLARRNRPMRLRFLAMNFIVQLSFEFRDWHCGFQLRALRQSFAVLRDLPVRNTGPVRTTFDIVRSRRGHT